MSRWLHGLNLITAVLFAFSVGLQINDPDWYVWIPVYAYGLVVTLLAAKRRYTVLSLVGFIGYFAGFLYLAPGLLELDGLSALVTDVRMDAIEVEMAREAGGLFLGASWMLVLTIVWRRGAKACRRSREGAQVSTLGRRADG